MDTTLTVIYCLADDMLQALGHRESPQRSMNDAEVMTTALAAARFFGGNFATARDFMSDHNYVLQMLSKSQFNRRLHEISHLFKRLFELLASLGMHRDQEDDSVFVMDSFPAAVCENIRISQCRIYPEEASEGAFRGYIASKKQYFYGVKVHLMTTKEGHPVEVFLTPGSRNDTRAMRSFSFNLPEGSVLYGDKAYNDYQVEDRLEETAGIDLLPLRKKNSTRKLPVYVEYVQRYFRKRIETAGSLIKKRLPESIHAVTAAGFELKVYLFVLVYSIDCLL